MPSIELASVSEKTLHLIAFWEFHYQSHWLKTIWTDRRKFTLLSKTLHGEYGRDYARRTSGWYDGMPVNTMATIYHMKSRQNASQSSNSWNQMTSKVILVEAKKQTRNLENKKKIERVLLFRKQTYWRHKEIKFIWILSSINFCWKKKGYCLFEFFFHVSPLG